MIQYQLTFQTPLPVSAGYNLYAFLLQQLPPKSAADIHDASDFPISQWVQGTQWVITSFRPEVSAALDPILAELRHVRLNGYPNLFVKHHRRREVNAAQLLETPSAGSIYLTFRTPTAFKSHGVYQLLPTQELVMQSLLRRWNLNFPDLAIEDEGGGLQALTEGLVYRNVQLQTASYQLKNTSIPGVCGCVETELRLNGFHRQLACALLHFAGFAGLGIKTSLGMGGTAVHWTEEMPWNPKVEGA